MINLALLEKRGCSAAALKVIFEKDENRLPTFERTVTDIYGRNKAEPKEKKKEKERNAINELRNRIRLRIQNGRDTNLANHRHYHAIDLAMDVPLRKAVTPTILQSLVQRDYPTESEAKAALSAAGIELDDLMFEVPDRKVDGKPVVKVSAPAFFQIIPPLVAAYKTIRQAKIMNDLLLTPFYPYDPAFESAKSRLQCDAITSRVEVMSEQLGYYNVEDQCVSNMLTYGRSFKFPVEEWFSEEQEVESEKEAAKDEHGKALKNEAGQYYKVVKEGVRHHVPHPARTFCDQAHPMQAFNTDSGPTFSGYWRVKRYRDVENNPAYFNRDKISIGGYDWSTGWPSFFSTVYPCILNFPSASRLSNDRETQLLDQCYSTSESDKAIVITEYFEKLVPKDWGLGDYRYPVWFRFVVGGDDTIMYAAPLPYAPTIVYPYDHDQNKAQNSSLALEVLPWQDHLGNLLTQYILTIKQNLTNATFVDTDMVSKDDMAAIKNLGEKVFRKRNFIPFSAKLFRAKQAAVPNAFYSHSFPQLDANGIVQAMRMLLDMLERVLQMSSQELGQAASHEQTKGEINVISSQTSTRLQYTTTPVHQAREATKKQIYYALMAYGTDDFWVSIPFDTPLNKEQLEEMGFTYADEHGPATAGARKIAVRVKKKSALMLESFAAMRPTDDRSKDKETAMVLLQTISQLIAGPIGSVIGAEQAVMLVNVAGKLAGWPKDFKLKPVTHAMSPDEQAKAIQDQLAGMVQQIESKILNEVKGGLQSILERQKHDEEAIQHITEILGAMQQAQGPALLPPPQPQSMPMPMQQQAMGQPMPQALPMEMGAMQ